MVNEKVCKEMETALYLVANYLGFDTTSSPVPLQRPNEDLGDYRRRLAMFTVDIARRVSEEHRKIDNAASIERVHKEKR